jgi:hypothetical protein
VTGSDRARGSRHFRQGRTIDDIKSVKGRDLDVTRKSVTRWSQLCLHKEIHLAGPAYLLLKYAGQTK